MMKTLSQIIVVAVFFQAAFVQAADITVSAAASLKDAFQEMAKQYQQHNPQDKIKLNTAASGVLLQQITQGAPVDVFASADVMTMNKAIQQNAIQAATRHHFARNALVLVVPKTSALGVRQLGDLQKSGVKKIAIGKAASVPAGAYAQNALQKQQLFHVLKPKLIYTQNVRQALDYVARGEVDAAFVYRTDALFRSSAVQIVAEIPTDAAIVYPIALTRNGKSPASAKRFVDYVLSAQGQAILRKHGFARP